MAKYAQFNAQGFPVAFYTKTVHGDSIPADAVTIADVVWEEFINNPGRRVWDGSKAVMAPPAPTVLYVPPTVSRRQFAQALAEDKSKFRTISWDEAEAWASGSALPKTLTDILAQLPDPADRARARMFLLSAGTFDRSHPQTLALGQALQWSSAKLDALWIYANTL